MARVAVVQMTSGDEVGANLAAAARFVAEAAAAGAALVVLPENFAFMGAGEGAKLAVAEADRAGPIQDALSGMARTAGCWLVGGTVPLRAPERPHAPGRTRDGAPMPRRGEPRPAIRVPMV